MLSQLWSCLVVPNLQSAVIAKTWTECEFVAKALIEHEVDAKAWIQHAVVAEAWIMYKIVAKAYTLYMFDSEKNNLAPILSENFFFARTKIQSPPPLNIKWTVPNTSKWKKKKENCHILANLLQIE